MKKKILLGLVAVLVVSSGVAALSAFEAHVINVTAHIENALSVTPEEILFGTVFPQEKLYNDLDIRLSTSFLGEDRVDDVEYIIKQKPKPRHNIVEFPGGVPGHVYCLENDPVNPGDPNDPYYVYCYPNLCGYLSKLPDEDPGNDTGVPAPHDPAQAIAYGRLAKSEGDEVDIWTIDLVVPCFEGMCDQTYDPGVYGDPLDPRLESQEFGCDLWIEVTDISRVQTLRLENKDPDDWSIIEDDRYGTLVYNDSGPTFNYNLTAQGLDSGTDYSLIYYGDPWAGDHPGAFIGSGTTNGSGDLSFSGNVELNMDLPHPADANYPGGAKIWLVPSIDYDPVNTKMIAWRPTEYLFEYNLITYDDTDI